MLDPLVYGKDGQIAGSGQAAGVVHGSQVAEDRRGPVRLDEDAVQVIGAGEEQVLGSERLGGMSEQRLRLVTEDLFEIHGRRAYRALRARFGDFRALAGGPSDSSRSATS